MQAPPKHRERPAVKPSPRRDDGPHRPIRRPSYGPAGSIAPLVPLLLVFVLAGFAAVLVALVAAPALRGRPARA